MIKQINEWEMIKMERKYFFVDIEKEKRELVREWELTDTNKSFKQFMKLKNNQQKIIDKYRQILNKLDVETVTNISIIFDYPQCVQLTFVWKEDINIHQWEYMVRQDVRKLQDYFWSRGVNAYSGHLF